MFGVTFRETICPMASMQSRILFVVAALTVLSQPVLSDISTRAAQQSPDTNPACTFEGNQDFYGIGVRLGFYLQWIAGLISFVMNPDDAQSQAEVQTIFLLANFIALLVLQSTKAATTNVVVPILLFYMFFGGSVVVVTSASVSLRDWDRKLSLTRWIAMVASQAFVQLTTFSLLIYSFYFWCTGLRQFTQFPDECGGIFVFPVAHRVSVQHTTAGAVLGLLLLVILLIAVWIIAYKRDHGDFGWLEDAYYRLSRTRVRRPEYREKEEDGVPWEKKQRYKRPSWSCNLRLRS